jgi:hypothetical protein
MSEVHVWTNAGGVLEKVDALKPRIRCENCRWWTPIVTVEPVAGKRYGSAFAIGRPLNL